MAAFNAVAAIGLGVFYVLYKGANGEGSYFLLIASIVFIAAAIGAIVLYNVFKRKLAGADQQSRTIER